HRQQGHAALGINLRMHFSWQLWERLQRVWSASFQTTFDGGYPKRPRERASAVYSLCGLRYQPNSCPGNQAVSAVPGRTGTIPLQCELELQLSASYSDPPSEQGSGISRRLYVLQSNWICRSEWARRLLRSGTRLLQPRSRALSNVIQYSTEL